MIERSGVNKGEGEGDASIDMQYWSTSSLGLSGRRYLEMRVVRGVIKISQFRIGEMYVISMQWMASLYIESSYYGRPL